MRIHGAGRPKLHRQTHLVNRWANPGYYTTKKSTVLIQDQKTPRISTRHNKLRCPSRNNMWRKVLEPSACAYCTALLSTMRTEMASRVNSRWCTRSLPLHCSKRHRRLTVRTTVQMPAPLDSREAARRKPSLSCASTG